MKKKKKKKKKLTVTNIPEARRNKTKRSNDKV